MTLNKIRSFIARLMPRTTLWRFLLATALLSIFTGTLAMGISMWIGRSIVYDIQEENGYTVLRHSVDQLGRSEIAVEELRSVLLENRKEALSNLIKNAESLMDSYQVQILQNRIFETEARETSFHHFNSVTEDTGNNLVIIDSDGRFRVHADSELLNGFRESYLDVDGKPIYVDFSNRIRASKTQGIRFSVFFHANGMENEPKLIAGKYYEPWDLYVLAEAYISEINNALRVKELKMLNELKARLREVIIGKNGYVFVFDEDCNMIAHPTLAGENIKGMKLPNTDIPVCEALKAASIKHWGENKLFYTWDRPDDKGNYVHEKVVWCTIEPTTGVYVGASAYLEEVEAGMPKFFQGIFFPALGSIMILGGALALLLRNLLRPVSELTRVCQKVAKGNLEVQAADVGSGEIRYLSGRFNDMIRSLRELNDKEQQRRKELEDLNKNLEKIVAVRTRALERKAWKLEEANIRLQELDKMKSVFLSSVSHELRTPLTSIRGFAKLIAKDFKRFFLHRLDGKDDIQTGKAHRIYQNVDIIAQEGERLTRLINDVLDLAKIESGRMEWRDSVFSMREVVDQSLGALSVMLKKQPSVSVVVDIQEGMPRLKADRDRFTQVMLNLLSNAIKFTNEGRVRIQACTVDGWIQVRVKDTGPGIERKDLLKVFDKFHQAGGEDTLKDKPKGTGLGLAICYNILMYYNGYIWAESEPGKGVEVVFEVAAHPEADADDTETAAEAMVRRELRSPVVNEQAESAMFYSDVPSTEEQDASKPLILVVDDEPSIQSYLRQIFENEGYRVCTAKDGLEAYEAALEESPDLITMDLLMPGVDGKQAIQRLRSHKYLRDVPIIVISVLSDRETAGGNAALDKPIDEARLMETVHGLLTSTKSAKGPCLVVEDDGFDYPVFLLCGENASYCTVDDLQKHIAQGFEGTVLIPSYLADELDPNFCSTGSRVQIIVVPEKG